jgi:hypothetical protein
MKREHLREVAETEEYIRLAEEALNEPDPKRALELCQKALEMERRLGEGIK